MIQNIFNKYLLSLDFVSSPKVFKRLFLLVIILQLGLAYIGLQLNALDLRIGFTQQDALALFMQLTTTERWTYLLLNALDYIYIFSYSLLLASLIFIAYRTSLKKNLLTIFCVLPLALGSFDYIETICISWQLIIWPNFQPELMSLSGWANSGKWLFVVINLFVVLVGLSRQLGLSLRDRLK